MKRFYRRKLMEKGLGKAKVAAARKLGMRLWIMLRERIDYEELGGEVVPLRGCVATHMVLRCSDRHI